MEAVDSIKTRVVGIDIRVARTTYAVVDVRGEIIAQDHFPTSDYPDVNDFVTALAEKIITMVEENGGYETVRSVGISAPSGNFLTGCMEMPPICRGKVLCHWLHCCRTGWDLPSRLPTMPISRLLVKRPTAVPMACSTLSWSLSATAD